MARFIPDVVEHISIFSAEAQNAIKMAREAVVSSKAASQRTGIARRRFICVHPKVFDEVMTVMKGARFDVARGLYLEGTTLRRMHPDAVRGSTPNILNIENALHGAAKFFLQDLKTKYLPHLKGKHVHLWPRQYDTILRQLGEQGFNVSKGLKCGNMMVVRRDHHHHEDDAPSKTHTPS